MSFLRWTPSFLGFPLGGWLAFQLLGPVRSPWTALIAGIIAGGVIGTAQWLTVKPAVSWRWIAASAVGMAAGSTIAAFITGSSTSTDSLVLTGLIVGAVVGAAQGLGLGRGWRIATLWTVTVSMTWAIGWLITANVIVDADHGYIAFGSSGAVVVTLITALVLRRILGRRNPLAGPPVATAAVGPATGNQL